MDLSGNLLYGRLPSGLAEKNLKFLSLSGNNFSGEIPSGLGQLGSLEFLNLSNNSLSGEVPVDLVALRNQTVLLLDNNKLSGEEEITAGVNAAAAASPVHVVTVHSVTGELFHVSPMPTIIRELTETRPGTSNGSPSSSSSSNGDGGLGIKEIVAIASASAIVVVLLVALTLCICTRKWPQRASKRSFRGREIKIFADVEIGAPLTYETVVRATGNFNASNCIGTGGFGATYRAEVAPGVLVAIKRLAIGKQHGDKEFQAEVRILGQCRHPHLVTLLGYHISESEMFLIYNYLPGINLKRWVRGQSAGEGFTRLLWMLLVRLRTCMTNASPAFCTEMSSQTTYCLTMNATPTFLILDWRGFSGTQKRMRQRMLLVLLVMWLLSMQCHAACLTRQMSTATELCCWS